MSREHRPLVGYLLAGTGVLVLLAEGSLHFLSYFMGREYELNHGVLLIAMLIGFVGFYILDPKGATDGTGIITRTIVGVVGTVRGGRRASDPDVVVTTEVQAQPPVLTREDAEAAAEAFSRAPAKADDGAVG